MTLFRRSYLLSFGGKDVDSLHIEFECRKGDGQNANGLNLTVFNLSRDTREKLESGVPVSLEAGYNGETGVIFNGIIKKVVHRRQGVDWVTSIEGTEGGAANRTKAISKSYGQSSTIRQVATDVASNLPYSSSRAVDAIVSAYESKQVRDFENGYVARGKPFKILSTLAQGAGLKLSVQNGELLALAPRQAVSATAVLLSPFSGLIGVPSGERKGTVVARSLMNAQILPGRLVEIQSNDTRGLYKVKRCTYRGSSNDASAPWEVEISAKDVQ